MDIVVKYITVGELESFVRSEEYLHQTFFPISLPRAVSHAHNPRSDKDDTALILAYDGKKLVGYLGAIPEKLFVNGYSYKICWFSCMWVLPEYRRSGIAKLLLDEAAKKYENKVLITNYIPRSKAAFIKNNQFSEVVSLKGVRAYLKLDLEQILIRKYPYLKSLKYLFLLADSAINFLLSLFQSFSFRKSPGHSFELIEGIDKQTSDFITNLMSESIFKRGPMEFKWLHQFPWIMDSKPENVPVEKYYFSQYSRDFKQWRLSIKNRAGELRGVVILTKHKRELKTPYMLVDDEVLPDLFSYVYLLMLKEKIRTLVTHHEGFAGEVQKQKGLFLLQRPSEYGFMATPEIVHLVGGNFGLLFEGDGDGMFT